MMKISGKVLLVLAVATSMLFGVMVPPASAQETTIGVEPDKMINSALQAGMTFKVGVWVRNVADLAGVEFKLGYNTTVLTATLIEYGGIFGETYFMWTSTINDAGGYLHYSISERWGEPQLLTSGYLRLAEIRAAQGDWDGALEAISIAQKAAQRLHIRYMRRFAPFLALIHLQAGEGR